MSSYSIFRPHNPEVLTSKTSEKDVRKFYERIMVSSGFSGLVGGSLVTLGASRFIKPRPASNTLYMTFFLSFFGFSGLATTLLLKEAFHRTSTQDDPDILSWRRSESQKKHDQEGGVGGMEEFVDKYATTRGDH